MTTNFSLDNFIISNTRSLLKDTDYCSVSITVGNNPAITKTQAVGNVDNGTHAVGLAVSANIPATGASVPVVFSYAIVNNGNGNHASVQKGLESVLSQIGTAGAKAAATAIGPGVGAALGATLGTAIVPILGSALGALAGLIVGEIGSILFANCDGPVAAGVHIYSSTDLIAKSSNGARIRMGENHPGVDSARGCGANSKYATNITISTIQSIATTVDLNGKWAYGGIPGPVIAVNGNTFIVDMSAYHRPVATGTILSASTISINFPDDKTYSVQLVPPGTLRFSNNSSWTKVAAITGMVMSSIPIAHAESTAVAAGTKEPGFDIGPNYGTSPKKSESNAS